MSRAARTRFLAGGGFMAAGLLAAVIAMRGGDGNAASTGSDRATKTATVERRDLVVRETVEGTLGYTGERSVVTAAAGTITSLPEPGTVIRRGQSLYQLNGKSITLFYGEKPVWRQLTIGSDPGSDVRQLEANLVALGFDPDGAMTFDGTFDWATRAAVARWERERGVDADGIVELGDLVFLPGPRRVGELKTQLGSQLQPAGEVLVTSSLQVAVSVELEAHLQSLVAEGDAVKVELPTGAVVDGRIRHVGTVASAADGGGDGDAPSGDEESTPTIDVEITLAKQAQSALDQAPVDVSLEKQRIKDALTMPVSALVALAGGGYAVEVVAAAGATRLVAVQVGGFADGYVQVSGNGIRESVKVVVPE